jgi:hypothetical protein
MGDNRISLSLYFYIANAATQMLSAKKNESIVRQSGAKSCRITGQSVKMPPCLVGLLPKHCRKPAELQDKA